MEGKVENMANGTKGDMYTKEIINRILNEGCLDKNPRQKIKTLNPPKKLEIAI